METTWSAEGDPRLAVVRRALEGALRLGLRPAKLAMAPETFALAEQAVLRDATTPLEVAWSVEFRFLQVLDHFGHGPAGEALYLLFGASPRSRSLPLKTRRRLAAEELDVCPATFRKLYEEDLLIDLAVEFARPS